MTTIDPTTFTPDVCRVRVGARETVAMRLDPDEHTSWIVAGPTRGNWKWLPDSEVTVLHSLDVPMQPWEMVREVNRLGMDSGRWRRTSVVDDQLLSFAARLEAEHRAAQEKSEQDAAREALIEKAARVIQDAGCESGMTMISTYRALAQSLADAGLLAEAADQ